MALATEHILEPKEVENSLYDFKRGILQIKPFITKGF